MTAIEFDHVGKQYRLGLVSTGTLAHDLNRFWQTKILHREDPYLKIGETNDRSKKGESDYVWALRDIDFKVEQGDVVGIIGRNGAGKSTLLKLLSRVTAPTTGVIRARGRIGSLLEVGTGFHPEMTGRENIFMNGTIMGMTTAEIKRKLDEIVDFSGCERYLDTPVKRYSSGMMVRLGFAVAAHLEPEILVVDEVLAVGDAEFQKKAIGKMQDVSRGGGRTVLFVSHNMAAVRGLCKRGVVLDKGSISFLGTAEDAIDFYTKTDETTLTHASLRNLARTEKTSGKVRFVNIRLLNGNDIESEPRCGGVLKIQLELDVSEPVRSAQISVGVRDPYDKPILSFPSILTCDTFPLSYGSHIAVLTIPKLPLTQGVYTIALHASAVGETADSLNSVMKINVLDDDFFGHGRTMSPHLKGKVVLCSHSWEIR